MKIQNLDEIVMKLIGPVDPHGDNNIDVERYENLKDLIELTDKLLFKIRQLEGYSNERSGLVKKIGMRAKEFINKICQ